MSKRKINVLVTGIGGGSHGEQIVKSLRLIKDIDIKLVGTDITPLSTGKSFVDKFYVVPPASDKNYEHVIFDIIKKHNISFIFHGSESELKFISENREKFEKMNIGHPLNSKEVINLCMNKYETFKYLESKGINVPKYKKISKIDDIDEIDFYPVVLKPNTNSGGSRHVYIALDEEDCRLIAQYLLKYNIDLIAQEYVGSHLDEYTIGVSSDINGEVVGSIVIKRYITNALTTHTKLQTKNNFYVISSGISQGSVCYHKSLQEQAEKIARILNSRGPLNIQCRLVDGQLMVMEINPRLSGTTSLRALAGYNEPEFLIKNRVFGERCELNYKEITIMRTIQEIIIDE